MANQNCTSTKKRGVSEKTQIMRTQILGLLQNMGKPVTVRQMFYQMSVHGFVEKEDSGYRKVQRQILELRRMGNLPYGWIADNSRWQRKPQTYDSLTDCLRETAQFYRQAIWRDIDHYVEVWCEKDALSGVLYPITSQYDVPLMVAKGYSSESFVHSAAEFIKTLGKPSTIYYVGDFDPSGWHMSQDLRDKFLRFNVATNFQRLAVNFEDIADLPSRDTKKTDTRTKAFFRRFGDGCPSVELDAVHPDMLRSLVKYAIEQHIPTDIMRGVEIEEMAAKESLTQFMREAS